MEALKNPRVQAGGAAVILAILAFLFFSGGSNNNQNQVPLPLQQEQTTENPKDTGTSLEDKDCEDFDTQKEAQDFFDTEGGPQSDPHDLDRDKDGVVCESLPND